MKLSRRAAMVAGAAVTALTAGCQSQETTEDDPGDSQDPESKEDENMTDRTPRHFDEDGNLTSPVDNESVITDELQNDDRGRPEWSTSAVSIEVGTDVGTLQEAVDLIPHVPYHEVNINVPSGTNLSTEDVIVPQTHTGRGAISGSQFERKIRITGDTSTPSNNPLGSITLAGVRGGFFVIEGFDFQNNNPYKTGGSDSTPVLVMDSVATVDFCTFSGGTAGIVGYGPSHVNVQDVNFGSNALSGDAVFAKHGASVQMQRSGQNTGNVGGYAYHSMSGVVRTASDDTVTGDSGQVRPRESQGLVVESDNASGRVTTLIGKYGLEDRDVTKLGGTAVLDADQSLPSGQFDPVAWDSTTSNDRGEFDATNSWWVPSEDGKYDLFARVTVRDATNADLVAAQIGIRDGSSFTELAENRAPAGITMAQVEVRAPRVDLVAGDQIELQAYQDSGASQDIKSEDHRTAFTMTHIG